MRSSPGAIIELPKLADEPLEIMVGRKTIGYGRAVKVGENFGVSIGVRLPNRPNGWSEFRISQR